MSKIRHDPNQQRFHDGDAYLTYRRPTGDVIDLVSVQVPPDRRGNGLAADLTRAAFTYAAQHGLAVRPTCPYISGAFLLRNPDYSKRVER